MKTGFFFSFVLLFFNLTLLAQQTSVSGHIIDSKTGESLFGVNIVVDSTSGGVSDIDGNYYLKVDPGKHILKFLFMGFSPQTRKVNIAFSEDKVLNIQLRTNLHNLDMVVVSAGRYQQKLSELTVSMTVIKPDFIENTNTASLEKSLNMIPGVEVMDGQTSIRGGSGYSYGAGSRVMFLVDGLPIITPDAGDVKWGFLPVENIDQIEVLKGASSALYGSSALNGVVNIRTASPKNNPVTKIQSFAGLFMNPKRKELIWWGKERPFFTGASAFHSRKMGNIDLTLGANAFQDAVYRTEEHEKRMRMNVNFRYRDKKIKGLSYGINTNIMHQDVSDFFIWINADSGAYQQKNDVITPSKGFRFNVDPYVMYFDKKGNKHSFKTRYFRNSNNFKDNPDKNNASNLFFGEYQFHREFKNKLILTSGILSSYANVVSNLYGDHFSKNAAIYSQIDKKFFDKFGVSFGFRWETYNLDNLASGSKPVIRTGLNYQLADATFIRASFGQGYRFPSIAEKYTSTSLGSINIFPNPDLNPETGWSAELGIKQGIEFGEWKGFFDAAGFINKYHDMIEFTFGLYKPDSVQIPTIHHLGFKSLNVGNAIISGFELNFTGGGKILNIPITMFTGYTYTYPLNMNTDSLNEFLKYRFLHSVKGDIELDFHKIKAGISFNYHSFIKNIDKAFEDPIILGMPIFPGLKEYRQKHNKGNFTLDLRFSYQISFSSKISLILKNALNNENMERPGDIQPPRNLALQYLLRL